MSINITIPTEASQEAMEAKTLAVPPVERGGEGGSTVVVTPILTSGTHIADIDVDGETSELYAPDASVTRNTTRGTKVASINGTDIYAGTPLMRLNLIGNVLGSDYSTQNVSDISSVLTFDIDTTKPVIQNYITDVYIDDQNANAIRGIASVIYDPYNDLSQATYLINATIDNKVVYVNLTVTGTTELSVSALSAVDIRISSAGSGSSSGVDAYVVDDIQNNTVESSDFDRTSVTLGNAVNIGSFNINVTNKTLNVVATPAIDTTFDSAIKPVLGGIIKCSTTDTTGYDISGLQFTGVIRIEALDGNNSTLNTYIKNIYSSRYNITGLSSGNDSVADIGTIFDNAINEIKGFSKDLVASTFSYGNAEYLSVEISVYANCESTTGSGKDLTITFDNPTFQIGFRDFKKVTLPYATT